jgi:peptide chain release factor
MGICLLITSGGGPVECRLAVAHVLRLMRAGADLLGLDLATSTADDPPASFLVLIDGTGAEALTQRWTGTIQWRKASALRPHHRRANWFIGVFLLPEPGETAVIDPSEVRFSTFRAGGPGGQHQNTTDSAVRAVWRGFTAISRDERSQHRNRAKALERLQRLVQVAAGEDQAQAARGAHRLHRELQRGNARRVFTGADFVEVQSG